MLRFVFLGIQRNYVNSINMTTFYVPTVQHKCYIPRFIGMFRNSS